MPIPSREVFDRPQTAKIAKYLQAKTTRGLLNLVRYQIPAMSIAVARARKGSSWLHIFKRCSPEKVKIQDAALTLYHFRLTKFFSSVGVLCNPVSFHICVKSHDYFFEAFWLHLFAAAILSVVVYLLDHGDKRYRKFKIKSLSKGPSNGEGIVQSKSVDRKREVPS